MELAGTPIVVGNRVFITAQSGSGVQFLTGSDFNDTLTDSFDLVSWDPRGMGGGTTPVIQCFENAAAEAQFMETHFTGTIARTTEDLMADSRARADFNAACIARNGDLLKHVSTADNARDLDLLRQEDVESGFGGEGVGDKARLGFG